MKREIRQNGKTVLYSGDGHSIPMIFNNLVGKNLKGREYSDYIAFVAIPDMGFTVSDCSTTSCAFDFSVGCTPL